MNQFKLLFIGFFFSSVQILAQSDFRQGHIITTTGDTINGLIDYQSDNNLCHKCHFKAGKDYKIKEYIPAELKEYQFDNDGRKFITTVIPYQEESKAVFLELLVAGKLNLYYCHDKALESYFFIQKRGEKHLANLPFSRIYRNVKTGFTTYLKTIDSSNHIDTLKKYMQDKPDVFSKIEDIDVPKQGNLIKLIKYYNGTDPQRNMTEYHVKKVNPLSIYLSPCFAATNFSTYSGNNYNLLGGIEIALSLTPSNERLFFNTGLLTTIYRNYSSHFVSSLYDMKYLIKVPVLFEYRFPDKFIQPRFSIGYNLYKSDLGIAVQSTISAGINIKMSKGISFSLMPGIDFASSEAFIILPAAYDSFCLFAGLQVKL